DGLYNRWQTVAFGLFAIAAPILLWVILRLAIGISVNVSLAIAIAILFIIWRCRGVTITSWQASILSEAEVGFESARLEDLKHKRTEHIFCATDLCVAGPFFFSSGFGGRLLSMRHGCADGSKLRIVTAVRASSAFPPLIPPLVYRSSEAWAILD